MNTTADNQVSVLMLAARGGFFQVVELLCHCRADVFARSTKGCTALSMAAEAAGRLRHEAIMKRLAARDVDARQEASQAELRHAEAQETVHLLVKQADEDNEEERTPAPPSPVPSSRPASTVTRQQWKRGQQLSARSTRELINAQDEYGSSALMIAAQFGDVDVVKLLLERNADVQLQCIDGTVALMMAARDGRTYTCGVLITAKADVNATRMDGRDALSAAASYGHIDTVRILLEKGADVNSQKAADGKSALMRASHFGHTNVCSMLIASNADTALQTIHAETALHLACEGGHERAASILLAHDADVDGIRTSDLFTPLMCAAAFGHIAVVNTLIKEGADYNYKRGKDFQDTCLHRAAKFSRVGVVDVLLRTAIAESQHFDIEDRDYEGRTALHLATLAGSKAVVRALIRAGANVNSQCDGPRGRGYTPLMCAIESGNLQMVTFLCQVPGKGSDQTLRADPDPTHTKQDRDGLTAPELADLLAERAKDRKCTSEDNVSWQIKTLLDELDQSRQLGLPNDP